MWSFATLSLPNKLFCLDIVTTVYIVINVLGLKGLIWGVHRMLCFSKFWYMIYFVQCILRKIWGIWGSFFQRFNCAPLSENYTYRRVRRGSALGARALPPPLGKKFRLEMSKRGEKVPPRYVGKKRMCTFRSVMTKLKQKRGKKEEKSKRKGLKLKK